MSLLRATVARKLIVSSVDFSKDLNGLAIFHCFINHFLLLILVQGVFFNSLYHQELLLYTPGKYWKNSDIIIDNSRSYPPYWFSIIPSYFGQYEYEMGTRLHSMRYYKVLNLTM